VIQKKICLLGAFSVGKTSLIKRYVDSIFEEKYLTTVGVKIDKKLVEIEHQKVMMMIWDLAGEDDFCKLQVSYLRGASGYVLVGDPTRPHTLDRLFCLHKKAQKNIGNIPAIIALNKHDLCNQWSLSEAHREELEELQQPILNTSAKTGNQVQSLFVDLATQMLSN